MIRVRGIGMCQLGQAPPLLPPGPTSTGLPEIDRIASHPIAKVITIGSLAATAAKVFPNQFFAPFVAMSVATMLLGIVPGSDFDVTGTQPTASPGAPPRVG